MRAFPPRIFIRYRLSEIQFANCAGPAEPCFGRLYLIHDPGESRIANQQLGYPLYIIPLIGVTHILGSVGLLIPKVPRLTEWVYAGFAITLLLAFYSQLNSGGSTWDKFDPILVTAFVFASYVLRRCMRANRWSI
jgi:hypothetical protein